MLECGEAQNEWPLHLPSKQKIKARAVLLVTHKSLVKQGKGGVTWQGMVRGIRANEWDQRQPQPVLEKVS